MSKKVTNLDICNFFQDQQIGLVAQAIDRSLADKTQDFSPVNLSNLNICTKFENNKTKIQKNELNNLTFKFISNKREISKLKVWDCLQLVIANKSKKTKIVVPTQ